MCRSIYCIRRAWRQNNPCRTKLWAWHTQLVWLMQAHQLLYLRLVSFSMTGQYHGLKSLLKLISCVAWAKESSPSGSGKQQHRLRRWWTSDLSKQLDREIVYDGGKKGATLSDWAAAPIHSHESPARGEKVSCAGGAAEWDVKRFLGQLSERDEVRTRGWVTALACCAGGTHTCSDVAGWSRAAHTLYSGHDSTVLHVYKSDLSSAGLLMRPGHANTAC